MNRFAYRPDWATRNLQPRFVDRSPDLDWPSDCVRRNHRRSRYSPTQWTGQAFAAGATTTLLRAMLAARGMRTVQ